MFAGNAVKQTAKKIEPIGFQTKFENDLFFEIVISDFEISDFFKKYIYDIQTNQRKLSYFQKPKYR